MRIQLWSSHYDPEPQGNAPLSRMLATALVDRGHDVLVVAAHPHHPEAAWGQRALPYRERRDGIPVLRLPLWIGRESGAQRVREELTFTLSQTLMAPLLPRADVLIAVTPSFPALGAAMSFAAVRRMPWVMWVQDIVTDGAESTGLLGDGPLLRGARAFERLTYAAADRIVVISQAFRANLEAKGVAPEKIVHIFNPSSRRSDRPVDVAATLHPPQILAMGNVGLSQGLDRIVDAFEDSDELASLGAQLVIAGHGVAAEEVRGHVRSERVRMPGVLYGAQLEPVLRRASIGLVSQRPDVEEFNLPSKLMNYLAYGIPVVAAVRPESETARIVERSGGGWVTDARTPRSFAQVSAAKLRDPAALRSAGEAGHRYARENFEPAAVAERFEAVLEEVVADRARR